MIDEIQDEISLYINRKIRVPKVIMKYISGILMFSYPFHV